LWRAFSLWPIAGETRKKTSRAGIAEFGLPYEQEPAITRHLGWFLEQHREDVKKLLDRDSPAPDLILFNGGALKPCSGSGENQGGNSPLVW
jgi:hypothetical protein